MSVTGTAPLELTVWMYHYVRDSGDEAEAGSGISGLPVAGFTEQLDEMAQHNAMLSWPDVRAALLEGRRLPADGTLLTFDDGVRDHYLNVYPLLKARGLSGLCFGLARTPEAGLALGHKLHYLLPVLGQAGLRAEVYQRLNSPQQAQFRHAEEHYRAQYKPATTQGETEVLKAVLQRELSVPAESVLSDLIARHVGDETALATALYLQPDQIHEMAAGGMHFGGHSVSHPWFDLLGPEQLGHEIAASASWLADIEPGPWAFAYPYGGLNPEAPRLLAAHGFAAAFTTKARLRHDDPYLIGRLDGEEVDAVRASTAHA